jgi:hypothetical protein
VPSVVVRRLNDADHGTQDDAGDREALASQKPPDEARRGPSKRGRMHDPRALHGARPQPGGLPRSCANDEPIIDDRDPPAPHERRETNDY